MAAAAKTALLLGGGRSGRGGKAALLLGGGRIGGGGKDATVKSTFDVVVIVVAFAGRMVIVGDALSRDG